MQIGLFIGTLGCGGAERMMINLAYGLAGNGNDVTIYLINKVGVYSTQVPGNVKVHSFDAVYGAKSVIHKIRKTLKYDNLDVIISTQEHINASVCLASLWLVKRPKIILREASTPSQRDISCLSRKLYGCIYKYADHYVAVSDESRKDIESFYRLKHGNTSVIYNPVVDDSIFQKADEFVDHPWFQSGGNIPVIVGMGRIVPLKAFENLIDAFAILRNLLKAKLVVFGSKDSDPRYFEFLINKVRQQKLEQDVDFPGFVDNPFKYLSKASLFVLTSKYEGLPGALIQAMACGCPVVSTDCPSGPGEILEQGKYGKLVEVGNIQQIAAEMFSTLEAPMLSKEELKKRSLYFSIEASTQGYLKVIKSLID